MKKLAVVVAALALLAAGCGQTDRTACADLDRVRDAVAGTEIEREQVAAEISDDIAEEKAVYNCSGYDAWWQDEED